MKFEKNLKKAVSNIKRMEEIGNKFEDIKYNKDFSIKILSTSRNFKTLLNEMEVEIFLNIISQREYIKIKNEKIRLLENKDLTMIRDELLRAGISTQEYVHNVLSIASQNLYNPAKDYIQERPWDGNDRIQALADTLVAEDYYDSELKYIVIRKWLRSLVVSAMYDPDEMTFSTRNILTLKGPQNQGKTSWLRKLFPNDLFKDGLGIDPNNKDSVITATSYWCVEMGELERVFKSDVSALKAFLTSHKDDLRRPYDRLNELTPRRTVFCASVNMENFLADETGSTRFSVIPLQDHGINYRHNIDVQQIFAQIYKEDYLAQKTWFLDEDELKKQCAINEQFDVLNDMGELIITKLNLPASSTDAEKLEYGNASKILNRCGIDVPNKAQLNQAVSFMKKNMERKGIKIKKTGNSYQFPVPLPK